MQVIHAVRCGIDVHAAQLTACLRRVSEDGQITMEVVDVLGRQIAELDDQLRALLGEMAPLEQLGSLPGVSTITDILAEIGVDRQRFGSASRLASWAGLSPGNHARGREAPQGSNTQGQSVSAPSVGAMCLGNAQAPKLFGSDVSPLGGAFGLRGDFG